MLKFHIPKLDMKCVLSFIWYKIINKQTVLENLFKFLVTNIPRAGLKLSTAL